MVQAEAHLWTDPIVEEVRAARDAIAAKHGYDVEKIAAAFAERSKASGRRTASPSPSVVKVCSNSGTHPSCDAS